jgi:hypothetical protein
MSVTDVPVLPIRAGRHLATWIVWHTARVSLVEDLPAPKPTKPTRRKRKAA